jgi:FtsZ-binding cell division protein ZapB
MTPSECRKVRDLVARNRLLTLEVERLRRENAYLKSPKRDPYEPRLVKRLRDRADRQRARAEMWKIRALRRAA